MGDLPWIFVLSSNDFHKLFDIIIHIVFHMSNLDVDWSTVAEIECKLAHRLRPGG